MTMAVVSIVSFPLSPSTEDFLAELHPALDAVCRC